MKRGASRAVAWINPEFARSFVAAMRQGLNYGPTQECAGCGATISLARDEHVAASFAHP